MNKKGGGAGELTTDSLTKKKRSESVVINVAIIRENEKGVIGIVRGSKLPVQVGKDSTAFEVLSRAVEKHANHDQFFASMEEYVLLYPDQKVVQKVPGSKDDFTVFRYKKELAKPYSKVDLYLCKVYDLDGSGDSETVETVDTVDSKEKENIEQQRKIANDTVLQRSLQFRFRHSISST